MKQSFVGRQLAPSLFLSNHQSLKAYQWGHGMYTYGAELMQDCMDVVRKQVEECDNFQGFSIAHAMGGGTGSGYTSLITSK